MTKTILGKVSLTPKGTYSASVAYYRLDVVAYSGSSYLVLKDNLKGVTPIADNTNYMLLAKAGDKGPAGDINNINDVTIAFTQDTTRGNIQSGWKFAKLFGMIQKWFADLKGLAFKDKVNWNTDVENKPTSMPASDVSAWAKAATKPSYAWSEITGKPSIPAAQQQVDWNATSGITSIKNKPTSMPASDVPAWAKAAAKPKYTAAEVGASPSNHNHAGVYVPVVAGKGLSANDFTNDYKKALDWAKVHTAQTTGVVNAALGANFTITASENLAISFSNLASIIQGEDVSIRIVSNAATARTITLPTTGIVNETGMTTAVVTNINSLELNIKRFGDIYIMKGVHHES